MKDLTGRDYFVSDSKYLKLNLTIPYEDILSEVRALRHRFISYYSGESNVGWLSLPIVGIDSTKPCDWAKYGYKSARDAASDSRLMSYY